MFNTMLDSLGRKKAKENPWFVNARSSQRHKNHEEFQGLTQKPFCDAFLEQRANVPFREERSPAFRHFSLSH